MLQIALSEDGRKCGVQHMSAYVIQDTEKVKVNTKIIKNILQINLKFLN